MPDKEIAAANLAEVAGVLDGLGIPFSLFLGTALGAWRDGDFCEGDVDDIDLAIHVDHYYASQAKGEAGSFRFEEALVALGYEMKAYWHKDAIAPQLAFTKHYGEWKSKIDLFFITPKDGDMVWSFYTATGPQNRRIPVQLMTTFTHCPFYGRLYNIPDRIEEYLEANYGPDWRTPIPRSNWDWEKDNRAPMI